MQAGGWPQIALELLGVLHLVVAGGCVARPAHNLRAGRGQGAERVCGMGQCRQAALDCVWQR